MKPFFTLILIFLCWHVNAQYNYLGTYSADGTPDYLEPVNDIISAASLEAINAALPERYPVPDYNPHYISSGYETNIHLTDSAAVYVTFVAEGAGYKNVLGFYTYEVGQERTKPQDEDITIIFPNISAQGSGGSLVAGNKVKIGNFAAGTGIGWVLFANGWNGHVTFGQWTLYSDSQFNPEADVDLKQHNVLLQDEENQRVILGFEDIRRDNAGCDNDFNDAIFYITANPFEAMELANVTTIESANTDVTSGNDGGLESNGKLASALAQRFFKRSQSTLPLANLRLNQKSFKSQAFTKALMSQDDPAAYIPQSGMTGTESAYVSSPQDLIALTNAQEIFSADYYLESGRVGAVLASKTKNRVYDHSKTICDRLNGARLIEVRPIKLKNFGLINSVIQRASGQVEYALSFSLNLQDNKVYSLWNIDQYPAGDYLNYQFWGSSMGQVSALAGMVLENMMQTLEVSTTGQNPEVPQVFVAAGKYLQGQMLLTVVNKHKLTEAVIHINATAAEGSETEKSVHTVQLNGELSQEIVIPIGSMFDAGLSLKTLGSSQEDALYLADGAWGVDYQDTHVSGLEFEVQPEARTKEELQFQVARGPQLRAQVKGTLNLFRNLLAGNQSLDISPYKSLTFEIQSEQAVEVILVAKDLDQWENRARVLLPASPTNSRVVVALDEFTDASGKKVHLGEVKSLVFSIQGDYQQFKPAAMQLANVTFSVEEKSVDLPMSDHLVHNFPNPFTNQTTFHLSIERGNAQLILVDLYGKKVYSNVHQIQSGRIRLIGDKLAQGIYQYKIVTDEGRFHGRLIKQ